MNGQPEVEWEMELQRDGLWPTVWRWCISRRQRDPYDFDTRGGQTFTKERARRKALRAKASMERDDVKITYPAE